MCNVTGVCVALTAVLLFVSSKLYSTWSWLRHQKLVGEGTYDSSSDVFVRLCHRQFVMMFAPFFAFSIPTPRRELCEQNVGFLDNYQKAMHEPKRSRSKLLQAYLLACQRQALQARFREWRDRVKYQDTW